MAGTLLRSKPSPVSGVVETTDRAGGVGAGRGAACAGSDDVERARVGASSRAGAGLAGALGGRAGAAPCTTTSSSVAADCANAAPGSISAPNATPPNNPRFRARNPGAT